MPTIGADNLRKRAGEYIGQLVSGGYDAQLLEDSFRDYMVKVKLGGNGAVKIYYKPSKSTFSADFSEISHKSIIPQLEDIWHGHTESHNSYRIYVDGSFCRGTAGYGYVVVKDNRAVYEANGALNESETAESAQIAGELRAVRNAIEWCASNGIAEAEIYYDYAGIEKWASGEWKANHAVSKAYAEFMKASRIKIKWHKVDAHTGDRWNSIADKLARSACGV